MNENIFQAFLIKEIKKRFKGAFVLKNDPTYIQGIPDLIVLFNDKWAALEVKKSIKAHHQPNQDFYVQQLHKMSYAAFVAPENYEEVLDDLQRTFGA